VRVPGSTPAMNVAVVLDVQFFFRATLLQSACSMHDLGAAVSGLGLGPGLGKRSSFHYHSGNKKVVLSQGNRTIPL